MGNIARWSKVFITLLLSFQMLGCGTILYPQRKGQVDGRLDVGVVLLDGVGLLLFIIPGVIAYAIDFSNGTIYLPGTGSRRAGLLPRDLKAIEFDVNNYTPDMLRAILRKETGYDLDWQDERLQVIALDNKDEVAVRFAKAALPATAGSSLASNR